MQAQIFTLKIKWADVFEFYGRFLSECAEINAARTDAPLCEFQINAL